jgi:hypothetical protein
MKSRDFVPLKMKNRENLGQSLNSRAFEDGLKAPPYFPAHLSAKISKLSQENMELGI